MKELAGAYSRRVQEEEGKTQEQIVVDFAGKLDPKARLEGQVTTLMSSNIIQCLGTMLGAIVF